MPVDVVVGTSAGSIVAAAYASGMPLAQIADEMSGLRTVMLFRDVDRGEVPLRNKINDAVNYIGPEIGLKNGGVAFPEGVVAGVSIEAVLRQLTVRQRSTDFDKLPIPFRAIATDLTTSEMIVIDKGNLAVAVAVAVLQLSGYRTGELIGREMTFGRLIYNYRVSTPGLLDVGQRKSRHGRGCRRRPNR
ncbi:MAG: patatin-like phospholipase family protein, partial [Burkholderiales bacterium]